jgi:hypothetical protein
MGWRMKAQLTSNVPGGLSGYNRPNIIKAAYKSHATQNAVFHGILANSQMVKRIISFPDSNRRYVYQRNKYGQFTQMYS